jgi:3-carboxy-cis,cis-muconate cycloisomerase
VGGGLFTGLFVPEDVAEATSDEAWVQAMLDVEAALARAQAEAGIVPKTAADAIAGACDARRFDAAELARAGRDSGFPVAPLVRALSDAVVDEEAARYVHWGATSQDVMDTASMLIARRALALVDRDLQGVADACAGLAREHRSTPMAGRTLLQQALPTTFGLKAAVWLSGVAEARERLAAVPLTAELGGAAGTLASLGSEGARVLGLFAAELGLEEPPLPWHTMRVRVAQLASALAATAGALEKVAVDLSLLAQTEVGEVAESSEAGRGGSSTLPHKRNPVGAVLTAACARRVRGAVATLLDTMAHEHERAVGDVQAGWPALNEALALTGGAASSLRGTLEGLEVRPERMAENLELTNGLLMAESVMMAIAGNMGRLKAKQTVEAACRRAVESGRGLREVLHEDDAFLDALGSDGIDEALDPARYVGSAEEFVNRALARYAEEGS